MHFLASVIKAVINYTIRCIKLTFNLVSCVQCTQLEVIHHNHLVFSDKLYTFLKISCVRQVVWDIKPGTDDKINCIR